MSPRQLLTVPHVQLESGLWPGSFGFRFLRMCIGLLLGALQNHAKPCSTVQYRPMSSGWQQIIDRQEKTETERERERERERDAFAILHLLSYHVSSCLFCSVKAQLNEAHAVLSCPTQRLGPQVVNSYYQLKPADTSLHWLTGYWLTGSFGA